MMTNEQIERFFRQECFREEAGEIGRFLEANPGKALAFLMEEGSSDNSVAMAPERSRRLWRQISRHTRTGRGVSRTFFRVAVAASLIIAMGLSVYLLQHARKGAGQPVQESAIAYTVLSNNGATLMQHVLPDGTMVQLMPESNIRFEKGFAGTRTVLLSGKARFEVAKDEKRPFVVLTDAIAVNALGTAFEISAFAADDLIYVHLLSGKVAVKPLAKKLPAQTGTKILTPRQRLIYHKVTHTFTVTAPRSAAPAAPKLDAMIAAGETFIEGDNWYMFNNHALPEVLDELSGLYRKSIQYNRSELKNMSFIGRLDKSDSLHKVLRSIALLNDLTLTKTNTGYMLKK